MTKASFEQPGKNLAWAGKLVRMEEAEEVLTSLWHLSADNVRISQNVNVRASVLNFVICAPDVESAQRASSLLRDLCSTHIARVILLILDSSESAPTDVSTWVTLRSFPIISDIMRHNFEQITLRLAGPAIHSAATIIQPLFKPDLPIYLWWLADPPHETSAFTYLAGISSRVIVDSDHFTRPEQSLAHLASMIGNASPWALSDLNWGRITPWRQLIAQFFDVPEYQQYLSGIYRIEIEHAVSTPQTTPEGNKEASYQINPTRALMLSAWLLRSLSWEIDHNHQRNVHNTATGEHTWYTSHSTGKLPIPTADGIIAHSGFGSISIRPRLQPELPPGTLCLVRLLSTVDNKHVTFTIDRADGADHALTSVELPEGTRHQRTVSLGQDSADVASTLLHDELEIVGHDRQYEAALNEIYDLLVEEQ
ncbi:glucose-6-phosphate dehydrogenase assembly protein OpcA [Ktedonospora formicarum]|uniref:Glucose-6-phosphate dehydrogenase n=1 Tax=Ktedonospora formicarum TaxID=2778364 RepID=A0A8J3HW20_9CHLR|nr:glucose-6-phosphate dehydrogenase assembly protein OpcA [Ktedonospora formicarum]GHO45137.1 glucose-6-phosphate dehydrogenase [Ktedonospora formicarum]